LTTWTQATAKGSPLAFFIRLGHISTDPDSDRVTKKLAPLHFYQLALPAVKPRPGIDFDPDAADLGDELFSGKANCNRCHREPLWTEPGWNQHTPGEMKIDGLRRVGEYRATREAGTWLPDNESCRTFRARAGIIHVPARQKSLLSRRTIQDIARRGE
jgi:hypothetical protein